MDATMARSTRARSTFADSGPRIAVVGTTCCGKTTLARRLSRVLGTAHVELDALHWESNWVPAETVVFRQRVSQALSGDRWVADGNYSAARDIVWRRATILIWLDYPLVVMMGRLFRRTLRRVIAREELWNGNRASFRGAFLSRDSLFMWALRTYRRRRREYPALFTRPEYSHLVVAHLRSPAATREWLSRVIPPAE